MLQYRFDAFKCEQCGQLHVGEMEISLSVQPQEHNKSVKDGDSKWALSHHQVMTGHVEFSKPVIEEVRVINSESRNIKSAIHIKLHVATLNRTEGYDLPDLYLPLLR